LLRRGLPLLLCVAALAAPAAASAGESTAVDYLALGDSVASGYGLGASAAPCYRSSKAYPSLVLDRLRARHRAVRFRFLACAGATASGGSGMRSLHQQVSVALRSPGGRPALVSLTIGINDLEWWNLARLAILVRESEARFAAWLGGTAAGVQGALDQELGRLVERPRTSVVLTGYFDPLNPGSSFYENRLICPDEQLCRSRVARVLARLNGAIRAAARDVGARGRVRFAPVAAAFAGHESARPDCGDAPPDAAATWIQDDCFHPNARGARAIAGAVDRAARRLGL
jgi:lysophospholipase L1-like esterase